MFIITAGYPFSGKTEFVKALIDNLSSTVKSIHINPEQLRPSNYLELPADIQNHARIATWEVAIEMLNTALKTEPPITMVILDTCASKANIILQQIMLAKAHKHDVVYVFVGATLQECKIRGGNQWPSKDIIDNYNRDFSISVPIIRKAVSHFFFIKNTNDHQRLAFKNNIKKIVNITDNGSINRIHKSKPPRSTIDRTRQKEVTRPTIRKNNPS